MQLGSQQAPLNLDAGSASPSEVVSRAVSDEEDSESDDSVMSPSIRKSIGADMREPVSKDEVQQDEDQNVGSAKMEESVFEVKLQQDDLASDENFESNIATSYLI
ncbi:unnamed protein product [Zymoseptoria tritici ST99CH_3D1]|nr:unnamed protein product [Zymoseptoria tritici ST99CH_3D1]